MKFAIRYVDDKEVQFSDDTYAFTISSTGYSEIYSSIYDLWRRIYKSSMPAVYEDLFVFGLSVFAIDKRMSRKFAADNWSRDISVYFPVHNKEPWESSRELIARMLAFLSGDNWDVHFYETDYHYAKEPIQKRYQIDLTGFQEVCLFSGGLDSLCGAIHLAEQGKSLLLLGHNEYPKLRLKQDAMAKTIGEYYANQRIQFFDFSANSRAPHNIDGRLPNNENTCRSRSLLFLTAATSIAGLLGETTKVVIPENGFISINVPLTASRLGTCSTRTTHPYFLKCFSQLLENLALRHTIENPFQFMSKREVVECVENTEAFKITYPETISCSHPCVGRWHRNSNPINCGYCYPCMIRKASLLSQPSDYTPYAPLTYTTVQEIMETDGMKTSDIKALMASVHRYKNADDRQIKRLIRSTGLIDADNLDKHLHVYKNTMVDVEMLLQREIGYCEDET